MEGNSTVDGNRGPAKKGSERSEFISNPACKEVVVQVTGMTTARDVGGVTGTATADQVLTEGVSADGGAVGAGNGGIVTAKLKQVKTKVTERPGKDGGPSSWLVGVGSAQVKVYCTPHMGRELYTISFWVDGKRVRRVFPTVEKAIAEAKEAGKRLNSGEVSVAQFSSADWAAFARARELLRPSGVALETAAAEYASAFSKLKGRASLDAAVEFYLRRHPIDMQVKRVAEVVSECLEAKRQDRLSARYVRQFSYDLAQFSKRFRGFIGDVSGSAIDAWLRSLDVSPRTRNNLRTSVGTLFSFAKAKRYVDKDHDELDAVGLAKESEGEIGIFRPAELQEMLAVARPELMPFLVLSAFAGIRHAEIQRLDWQDIRMKAGIIEIRAAKAKTASRRTVPIVPTLKKWLKVLADRRHADGSFRTGTIESGPVCEFGNLTEQFEILVNAVN
ncbi:MAG TPA: site-specific integrase, partial [Verrucomicrobiae bacterium]|nr:site-specific integrase [Verrucomicrobiae bacterium]